MDRSSNSLRAPPERANIRLPDCLGNTPPSPCPSHGALLSVQDRRLQGSRLDGGRLATHHHPIARPMPASIMYTSGYIFLLIYIFIVAQSHQFEQQFHFGKASLLLCGPSISSCRATGAYTRHRSMVVPHTSVIMVATVQWWCHI